MLKSTPATDAQIVENLHYTIYRYDFKNSAGKQRISFELDGTFETIDCRTENGVRHITRGSSSVRFVDRVPHVMRNGKLERLYAEVVEHDGSDFSCLIYTLKNPNKVSA